ncbi:hypothetical protein JG687_00019177 [Phytophthora cactorum]|uniref:Uncharacterized protein n=1 Tax=Phytophthora cactorum TaxID=29920 RepID=A0A8T1TK60_9STRA|nr:hypothetical protein JG687_00019177 [Phytophthora cactorum]
MCLSLTRLFVGLCALILGLLEKYLQSAPRKVCHANARNTFSAFALLQWS